MSGTLLWCTRLCGAADTLPNPSISNPRTPQPQPPSPPCGAQRQGLAPSTRKVVGHLPGVTKRPFPSFGIMTQRFWCDVVDLDREVLVCRVGYPLEFRILGKGPVEAKEEFSVTWLCV